MATDSMNGQNAKLLGVENKTRLSDHERRLVILEGAVFEIRDKLLSRPSWFVALVITALVGLVVALMRVNYGG